MPRTISHVTSNRRSGDQIIRAAAMFFQNNREVPFTPHQEAVEPVIYAFLLELFEVKEEEQHELCIQIQRKLGMEVDDQKYTVMVFKHLPGGGRTPVTVDLAIGKKIAERKLYDRYNKLHDTVEQDCLPPDQFYDLLHRNSAVEAKIELDEKGEYDEETTALVGQYDFMLYNVTSAVTTIPRFEQEVSKKKKWKKAPEDEEEEPFEEDDDDDDDEEEGSVDDWPEDDDSNLDNG